MGRNILKERNLNVWVEVLVSIGILALLLGSIPVAVTSGTVWHSSQEKSYGTLTYLNHNSLLLSVMPSHGLYSQALECYPYSWYYCACHLLYCFCFFPLESRPGLQRICVGNEWMDNHLYERISFDRCYNLNQDIPISPNTIVIILRSYWWVCKTKVPVCFLIQLLNEAQPVTHN